MADNEMKRAERESVTESLGDLLYRPSQPSPPPRNPFLYKKPTSSQVLTIQEIRGACAALWEVLMERLPPSRERSLAITKLEEVSMWGNKAVVFSNKPDPKPYVREDEAVVAGESPLEVVLTAAKDSAERDVLVLKETGGSDFTRFIEPHVHITELADIIARHWSDIASRKPFRVVIDDRTTGRFFLLGPLRHILAEKGIPVALRGSTEEST